MNLLIGIVLILTFVDINIEMNLSQEVLVLLELKTSSQFEEARES